MYNAIDSRALREVIRILERKLGVLQDNGFSCCGITMAQCHALVEIGRAKRISLNELSEILNLEKSTMSRTVNNLVNTGIAIREADPGDRRYLAISLTDKGNEMFLSIEDRMNNYFENVYDSIPDDKKNQVIESINILMEALKEKI